MNTAELLEECAVCLREIELSSEQERYDYYNGFIGEILCYSCMEGVGSFG